MTQETAGAAGQAAGRAKGELARARDIRFAPGYALLAGLFLGWAAVATKAALNEFAQGDTGYILLMAAAVLAAWFGGLIGGMTAIVVSVILNGLFFLGGDAAAATRVELVRQIVYVVAATGTVWLVATRRASRDRLVDALDEVAALAEEVQARDTRLEIMLAASGTGFWEWDIVEGSLTWSDAIFRQHGLEPTARAPAFEAYLDMIHPDDRELFRSGIQAALEGGAPFALDFRIVWPDGSIHWTHGAGRVLRDEAGRPVSMIGTGQDITERRLVEDQRDRAAHRGAPGRGIPRGVHRRHQPRAAHADHHDPGAHQPVTSCSSRKGDDRHHRTEDLLLVDAAGRRRGPSITVGSTK